MNFKNLRAPRLKRETPCKTEYQEAYKSICTGSDARWQVFYWPVANQIVIGDRFGLVDFINERVDPGFGRYTLYIRTRPLSRIPKSLVHLGDLE